MALPSPPQQGLVPRWKHESPLPGQHLWMPIGNSQPREPTYQLGDYRFTADIPPGAAPVDYFNGNNNGAVHHPVIPNYSNPQTSIPGLAASLETRLELARILPRMPINVPQGVPTHTHPVSHTLRQYHYYRILDAVTSHARRNYPQVPILIADIGGNSAMTRTHPNAPAVWHTRPYIDTDDYSRVRNPANTCLCALPDMCVNCQNANYATSVHSIYYLSKEVVTIVSNQIHFFAVVHHFPGLTGKINELTWTRDENDTITMLEGPGGSTYRHPAPDWIFNETYYEFEGVAMTWKIDPLTKDTYLVTFNPCPIGTAPSHRVVPDWVNPKQRRAYQKLISTVPDANLLGQFFSSRSLDLVCPIKLFDDMLVWWFQKEVNATNARAAMKRAATLVRDYPDSIAGFDLIKLVIASSTVAVRSLREANQYYDWSIEDFAEHNRIVQPGYAPSNPKWRQWLNWFIEDPTRMVAALAGVSVAAIGINHYGRRLASSVAVNYAQILRHLPRLAPLLPVPSETTPSKAPLYLALASVGVAAALWWFSDDEETIDLDNPPTMLECQAKPKLWHAWLVASRKRLREHPQPCATTLPPGPCKLRMFPTHCNHHNDEILVAPQSAGSVVSLPREFTCDCTMGNVLVGFGVSSAVPTVERSCTHNEVSAVMNRVTRASLPGIEHGWSYDLCNGLLRDEIWHPDYNSTHFHEEDWLSSLPGKQRNLYLTGHTESYDKDGDEHKAKLFVKRENAVRGINLLEHPVVRPRAIQSSTPEVNLVLGAYFSTLSKSMEIYYIEDTSHFQKFTYTSTPAQVGRTIADAIQWVGSANPCFASADIVNADCSVQPDMYMILIDDLKSSGAPQFVVDFFLKNTEVNGRTSTGVTYRCKTGLRSGVPYTTYTHSRIVQLCFTLAVPVGVRVALINKSDDCLLIYDPKDASYVQTFYTLLAKVGYQMSDTVTSDIYKAEFLSLRFYEDGDTLVASPKIGRTLSKLFYTHKPEGISAPADHARTVAIGLKQLRDVPILGAMIRRTLELTVGASETANIPTSPYEHNYKDYVPKEPLIVPFLDLYETSHEEIQEVERLIMNADQLPYVLHHPLLDYIVSRDLNITPIPGRSGVDNGKPDEFEDSFNETNDPSAPKSQLPTYLAAAAATLLWLPNALNALPSLGMRDLIKGDSVIGRHLSAQSARINYGYSWNPLQFTMYGQLFAKFVGCHVFEEIFYAMVPQKSRFSAEMLICAYEYIIIDLMQPGPPSCARLITHSALGFVRHLGWNKVAIAMHAINNIVHLIPDIYLGAFILPAIEGNSTLPENVVRMLVDAVETNLRIREGATFAPSAVAAPHPLNPGVAPGGIGSLGELLNLVTSRAFSCAPTAKTIFNAIAFTSIAFTTVQCLAKLLTYSTGSPQTVSSLLRAGVTSSTHWIHSMTRKFRSMVSLTSPARAQSRKQSPVKLRIQEETLTRSTSTSSSSRLRLGTTPQSTTPKCPPAALSLRQELAGFGKQVSTSSDSQSEPRSSPSSPPPHPPFAQTSPFPPTTLQDSTDSLPPPLKHTTSPPSFTSKELLRATSSLCNLPPPLPTPLLVHSEDELRLLQCPLPPWPTPSSSQIPKRGEQSKESTPSKQSMTQPCQSSPLTQAKSSSKQPLTSMHQITPECPQDSQIPNTYITTTTIPASSSRASALKPRLHSSQDTCSNASLPPKTKTLSSSLAQVPPTTRSHWNSTLDALRNSPAPFQLAKTLLESGSQASYEPLRQLPPSLHGYYQVLSDSLQRASEVSQATLQVRNDFLDQVDPNRNDHRFSHLRLPPSPGPTVEEMDRILSRHLSTLPEPKAPKVPKPKPQQAASRHPPTPVYRRKSTEDAEAASPSSGSKAKPSNPKTTKQPKNQTGQQTQNNQQPKQRKSKKPSELHLPRRGRPPRDRKSVV